MKLMGDPAREGEKGGAKEIIDNVVECFLSFDSIESSNGMSVHDLNQPGRRGTSRDWTEHMKSIIGDGE
jgi:hypothetical protein